jgi:Holliday junction DNA helicase RuvA
MIAFLEGELIDKLPTRMVVSVGGVGFSIHIPLSSYQKLGSPGSRIRVETYLYVREDALQLYGFATPEEKRLFEMLIALSGIGPGLALNILSGATVAEFTTAILTEDIKKLSTLPKVGRKTAQRLIMELRDTLTRSGAETVSALPMAASEGQQAVFDDAILGLVALGYDQAQARQAVAQVTAGVEEPMTAEQIIKRALQRQGGR